MARIDAPRRGGIDEPPDKNRVLRKDRHILKKTRNPPLTPIPIWGALW